MSFVKRIWRCNVLDKKMFLDSNQVYVKDSEAQTPTMFSEKQQNDLFEKEDKSWWFQYRAKVISKISAQYFDNDKLTIDIGGGNGFTTSVMLKEGFKMGLLEPSYQACLNGKKRNIPYVVNGSIDDIVEPCSQFTLLDVLEHIEDDGTFLDSIFNKLTIGGRLLITVPAYMSLWSDEDVKAGHFRRYKKNELVSLLESHRFHVLYSNYFFSFLYIPIVIVRVWYKRLQCKIFRDNVSHDNSNNQLIWGNAFVHKVLSLVEKVELGCLLSKIKVLKGSSLIIVVSK